MLDIKSVRENPGLVKASEKKPARTPSIVDAVLKLDEDWKKN